MYTAPACNGHCHCHRHCCHCCHTHAPQTRWYTQTTAPAMPYIYGSSIQSTTASGVTTNSGTTANINFSSGYQGPDEEPPAATAAPVS